MQKTKQNISRLSVLYITCDAAASGDLLQKLNTSGCMVHWLKAGEKKKKTHTQIYYDVIVIELEELIPELLEMCVKLITDLALLDTPIIIVAPCKNITTVRNKLWALPLVYFIQRDSSVGERVIAQAQYVNYLKNRYN